MSVLPGQRHLINILSRHQVHCIHSHPKPSLVPRPPVSTRLHLWQSCVWLAPSFEMEACWLPGLSGGSVWRAPVVLPPHGDSAVDSWGLWDSAFFVKPGDENAQHCSYQWDSLTSHQSCEKGRNLSVSQAWKAFYLLHNSFLIFQKSYSLRELCLHFPLLWRPLSSTVVLWIVSFTLIPNC